MKLNSAMLFGRYLNTTVAQLTKPCATYSTVRTVTTASLDASDHYDKAKPFSSIPGPSGLPYIGTLLYYKADGDRISRYHETILERYRRYGPIYRETIAGETDVHLVSPDYVQTVYKNEGKTPHIAALLETTKMYRRLRQMSLGLGHINGEEWYRLRSPVTRLMMDLQSISEFLPLINPVADDLVQRVFKIRDPDTGVIESLQNEIYKWSLESAGMTCFETRLGSLDADRDSWQQQMIDGQTGALLMSVKLRFSIPFHKLFRTSTWQKIIRCQDVFVGNVQRLTDKTTDKIRNQQGSSGRYKFLSTLLSRQDISYKDVSVLTLPVFEDGILATAPSVVAQLYCLASNPDKQQKLYEEIMQLAPDKHSPVTHEVLQKASYLKACIKEGFRLYPLCVEVSRISQKNLVIGGYQIPAGTRLSLNNAVLLRMPEYFKDPERFIPERWARDGPMDSVHPYLVLPFSFGTRSCTGLRMAQQEMQLLVIKLLQNFRLDWAKGEPELRQQFANLMQLERQPCIQFTPRN